MRFVPGAESAGLFSKPPLIADSLQLQRTASISLHLVLKHHSVFHHELHAAEFFDAL
jgi:hypothetical protein